MKILITESRIYKKEFLGDLNNHKIFTENIYNKNLLDMRKDIDVLLVALDTKIDEKAIEYFSNLKYIVTPSTGIDHICTECCEKKGIKIISLKGETDFLKNITATAEHTFGLILALTRKIPAAFESVKEYKWEREKFVGNELNGKTFGIIGFGRYGKIIAKYANAFNMNVIAYDISKKENENMKKHDVSFQSWNNIFQKSDIISIHIDLNEKTKGIIGKKEFGLMKNDSILINTSRGQIVDEEELVSALEKEKIQGAAIDVLASENQKENPINNPLIDYSRNHDNLIITPHIGGSTNQSIEKTTRFVLKKLITILNNDTI